MIIHCKLHGYFINSQNLSDKTCDFITIISDACTFSYFIHRDMLRIVTFGKNKLVFTHKNTIRCLKLPQYIFDSE